VTDVPRPLKPRPDRIPERVGQRALALFRDHLVWDNTMPWMAATNSPDIDAILPRWHAVGVNYVSLTVDFRVPVDRALAQIATVRRQARERAAWLTFAESTADICDAQAAGMLAVGVNLQDTLPYGSSLDSVQLLADLGVRQAGLAYNNRNFVGDGCAEPDDAGLSLFGRALIAEMNRVGVLVDGSHAGRRTTLEAIEICAANGAPFVFSHSNPSGVRAHYRNATDDQLRACAATGGVVGINGVGYWCGDRDADTEAIFRCLDYTVELVGADHVGLGFDYIHDLDGIIAIVRSNPIAWPAYNGEWMWKHNFAGAEQLPDLVQQMLDHGYPDDAIVGILGVNWERVANRVWGS
jgi:membrane dipeptidase